MFSVKIPKFMEAGNIRLMPLGLRDAKIILDGIKDFNYPAKGFTKTLSLLSFYLWLRKTYDICYCIELGARTIGFLGLYNLDTGNSAEISLMIFNKDNRRQGYGKQAFDLLAQNLKKYHVVEEIRATVEIDNFAAISFWKRMGFDELYSLNGIKTIALDLRGKQ